MNTLSAQKSGSSLFDKTEPLCLSPNHVKRDELVSKLLQDRNVLRFISAPHGFGKSELAKEYAVRLFSGTSVEWIDGESPDFLLRLDDERGGFSHWGEESPQLIVLDNIPWLHEERAHSLSRRIDAALYAGIEVIATALPSRDCLSVLQPDRLCIHAGDLLAREQECAPKWEACLDESTRALGVKRWKDASRSLFGLVPAVIWGVNDEAQCDCLVGLFGEKLSLGILKSMFAMLLLGEGSIDDLSRMQFEIRSDDIAMIARDYPIFGIDTVARTFAVAHFDLKSLKSAIVINKLEAMVSEGSPSLPERVLRLLFERGNSLQGSQVIEAFSSDERCASWLLEYGWSFLDAGEIELVSNLLKRCPEQAYVESPCLQAMHAWLSGLSGGSREACHIARRLLCSDGDGEYDEIARVSARLTLATFEENAVIMQNGHQAACGEGIVTAVDFLSSILVQCTNVEVARAMYPGGLADDPRLEKSRKAPTKTRARALTALVTEHAHRFKGSRAYCIALHLLAHVDNVQVRQLVQELGCDLIVELRRSGVTSFTSALLVRDMWQAGYFGLVGPIVDRRDAKLLDSAARMLNALAQRCGASSAFIPWEAKGLRSAQAIARVQGEGTTPIVEQMYVRLFGGFEVTIGDRYIGEGQWRKKGRLLIAILVLNQGRDVPREELFTQLWPGSSYVQALDNYYTLWASCSTVIGDSSYIDRTGEFCRIDARFVRSDVEEFEQLTRHLLSAGHDSNYLLDTYAKIEALYRGSLLPSETNVRMINAQRDRYRALYVDAMVAATECALHANDVRIALWFARKALEEDQGREDVYRVLMKAQISAGQRCPAIKTYLSCRDYLRNTMGLDPSLETRELYNTLVTRDPELLRLDSSSFVDM